MSGGWGCRSVVENLSCMLSSSPGRKEGRKEEGEGGRGEEGGAVGRGAVGEGGMHISQNIQVGVKGRTNHGAMLHPGRLCS